MAQCTCVSARCNCMFPQRVCWWLVGCPRGCIEGFADVCVCLSVDVCMPDLRLEVCVIEPPRVLVLDNWAVRKCMFLTHVCR